MDLFDLNRETAVIRAGCTCGGYHPVPVVYEREWDASAIMADVTSAPTAAAYRVSLIEQPCPVYPKHHQIRWTIQAACGQRVAKIGLAQP